MKRALRSLAIVALSGLVGLLLSEALVRVAAPQQLIAYRSDLFVAADTLHHVHAPRLNTTMNTGERTVRFITDADGYRIGQTTPVTAARVLVLGDSFMEAMQVDYEQSIAGRLESALPAVVRNTGTVAYGPSQYAVIARRMLARESFGLIVVGVSLENDEEAQHYVWPAAVPHIDHPLHWPDTLSFAGFVGAVGYPVNDWLEQRAHLFILARHTFQIALMRAHLSPLPLPVWYEKRRATDPAWDTTATILNEIATAARSVPVVYVLLPSSFQVDTADFNRYVRGLHVHRESIDLDQPNREIGERLRRAGRTVIDPTPALRAAVTRGIRTHGRFDPHLSPDGHRIITDLILSPRYAHRQ